jgi:hypothetical protein
VDDPRSPLVAPTPERRKTIDLRPDQYREAPDSGAPNALGAVECRLMPWFATAVAYMHVQDAQGGDPT